MIGAAVFWLRLPVHRGVARELILTQAAAPGQPPEEITAPGLAFTPE